MQVQVLLVLGCISCSGVPSLRVLLTLANCHPSAAEKSHSEGFFWCCRVLGGMDSSILMISATFEKTCMFYWQFFFGGIKSQQTNKSGSFWQWKYYVNEKDSSTEFLNLSVHPRGNDFPYATLLLMAYFSSMFPAVQRLCFTELFYRDRLIFNRWSDDVSMKVLLLAFFLTVQGKLVQNTMTSF